VVRTRLRACWSHGDGTDDGLSAPLSKLSIKGDHLWPLTAQVREFAPHETRPVPTDVPALAARFNLETLALVDSGVSAWGIGGMFRSAKKRIAVAFLLTFARLSLGEADD
jgi:hypothetical protein